MDAERQREIEVRLSEIRHELGFLEPADLSSLNVVAEHNLGEIEELYAERERLLQELAADCEPQRAQ